MTHLTSRVVEALENARTLYEISRLIGDVPWRCDRVDDAHLECLWRTSRTTFGHGTLAAALGGHGYYRKKLRLTCTLAIDGSPRYPESCRANVGA